MIMMIIPPAHAPLTIQTKRSRNNFRRAEGVKKTTVESRKNDFGDMNDN